MSAALPESARVIGRLARLFIDSPSSIAPDRCGVGPFTPDMVAAMPPAARAALAKPLSAECGLATVDLTAHIHRLTHEESARHAGTIATLPAGDLLRLARALAAIVYADLARRLVRKEDRARFEKAVGTPAATVAIRRTPFHAPLGRLAPEGASIADADRPEPASPPSPWTRPTTSALIAGEPPMVRHALTIIAAWTAAIAPPFGAILRARFGDFGPTPGLAADQRAALDGVFARQLAP
ncbi:MAG: hypothetical protein AAF318_01245 [Pseudomonadota bacterium]